MTTTPQLERNPVQAPARLPTVLLIDDDADTLSALHRCLRREPYELLMTQDPYEALDWLGQRDIALVITDEFMPAMLGTDLMEAARRKSPCSGFILLTGYPNPAVMYRGFQQRVDLMMRKPWEDQELRNSIRNVLRARTPGGSAFDEGDNS